MRSLDPKSHKQKQLIQMDLEKELKYLNHCPATEWLQNSQASKPLRLNIPVSLLDQIGWSYLCLLQLSLTII